MRLLVLAALAAVAVPGLASAQTWGQPYGRAEVSTYGQIYGPAPAYTAQITEWDGRTYAVTGHAATGYGHGYGQGSAYGDPHAYRPPAYGYGHGYRRGHDRGGRYGYSASGRWTRWSSPPGRGYHDAWGYNDDRAPRGPDRGHYPRNCDCGYGPYLRDR